MCNHFQETLEEDNKLKTWIDHAIQERQQRFLLPIKVVEVQQPLAKVKYLLMSRRREKQYLEVRLDRMFQKLSQKRKTKEGPNLDQSPEQKKQNLGLDLDVDQGTESIVKDLQV